MVPRSFSGATPVRSPCTWYMASRMAAVALMVMEVETSSRGIPSMSTAMSSTESMATPTRPTSPAARGWSLSRPI